ncbi:mitochondrial carrier domain-containing protein [Biscogniauxia marginata]|nr:mitochondrial carrier domain-containing protein [Biscogniauxia marginata]
MPPYLRFSIVTPHLRTPLRMISSPPGSRPSLLTDQAVLLACARALSLEQKGAPPANTGATPTMSTNNHSFHGQDHDRIPGGEDAFAGSTVLSSKDDAADDAIDISVAQKMLSAISGSLLTSLLATPLDVVRVRLQSQGSSGAQLPTTPAFQKLAISSPNAFRPSDLGVTACCREVFFMNNNAEVCVAGPRIEGGLVATTTGGTAGACAVEEAQKRTFHSTFDGMKKIARHEGITTLWRGLSPTLVMAVPANIIYFTGYDWLRFNKRSPINRFTNDEYTALIAGSTARVLAAATVSPIELFRTRLQASAGSTTTNHLANTFKSVREMVVEHGYRSLWRGLTLTLWRDVPFSGMYWWGYEAVRGKLTDLREEHRGRPLSKEPGPRSRARAKSQSRENHAAVLMDSFTAGALSGGFASLVTTPFDVGKTRTQVYRDSAKKAGSSAQGAVAPEERSMVRLLWHIFKTEGVGGLWKGWIPRTLKVAPACAIMISSYEVGKRVFRSMNERKQRKHQNETRDRAEP